MYLMVKIRISGHSLSCDKQVFIFKMNALTFPLSIGE